MSTLKKQSSIAVIASLLLLCSACSRQITQTGKASFYADSFDGKKTASGETFRQNNLTAAHPSLPFGTRVKVVNIANGRSVKVRINDRGPFTKNRMIDVSKKAAKRLGMMSTGVATVQIKYKKKQKA
ncbi:MAG: septal ring lytic transglycosylase RlpA family protein [Chitinophaga sp.]|uniref:septal ring lytic transglycosylase RlpA family protein n=1 Tax=Chitinophaga sp. TaxID=1869181 RepID=UPI0025BD2EA3|nr:septal ring lytic transglycosylase RlpA family protein [Chitinophaga sp.]MBV8254673.1 septal ring lytic transglycosylase RlpA family protein [Chitinophaga sp.]